MTTSGGPSQIRLTSSVNTRVVRTQWTVGLNSAGRVCVKRGATDLSRVRLDLGEEGFFGEVHDVVLRILSLHYCAAVRSRQLTLFVPGAIDQLGVFILQPAVTGQDKCLVNSNKVSSFLLLGCQLWYWINCMTVAGFTLFLTHKQKRLEGLPARFLPEVTTDANEQDCGTRSRGNAKLEPEIQRHTGADLLRRQRRSSETLQGLLPHVGGFLKCNNRRHWSQISCFPNQHFQVFVFAGSPFKNHILMVTDYGHRSIQNKKNRPII